MLAKSTCSAVIGPKRRFRPMKNRRRCFDDRGGRGLALAMTGYACFNFRSAAR
jgi:hypothetical protein